VGQDALNFVKVAQVLSLSNLHSVTFQLYRELESLKRDFFKTRGREVVSHQELADAYNLPLADVLEIYSQIALQNPQSLEKNSTQTMKLGWLQPSKTALKTLTKERCVGSLKSRRSCC
jgi:hypothetical protein